MEFQKNVNDILKFRKKNVRITDPETDPSWIKSTVVTTSRVDLRKYHFHDILNGKVLNAYNPA